MLISLFFFLGFDRVIGSVLIIIGLYAVLWGKSKEMKVEDHQHNMEKATIEKHNGSHIVEEKDDLELQITNIK